MKRAIASRIKITRTGKILRRPMGQGHFRAKKDQGRISNKKLLRSIERRSIKKYL